MFIQAFLDAFDRDEAHWYLDSFAANSLVDVTPRAPMRLYYGSKDLDVVPEEALAAARSMRARDVDVAAIDIGPVGTTHHAGCSASHFRVAARARCCCE